MLGTSTELIKLTIGVAFWVNVYTHRDQLAAHLDTPALMLGK